jgi:hypothetical protein
MGSLIDTDNLSLPPLAAAVLLPLATVLQQTLLRPQSARIEVQCT